MTSVRQALISALTMPLVPTLTEATSAHVMSHMASESPLTACTANVRPILQIFTKAAINLTLPLLVPQSPPNLPDTGPVCALHLCNGGGCNEGVDYCCEEGCSEREIPFCQTTVRVLANGSVDPVHLSSCFINTDLESCSRDCEWIYRAI